MPTIDNRIKQHKKKQKGKNNKTQSSKKRDKKEKCTGKNSSRRVEKGAGTK